MANHKEIFSRLDRNNAHLELNSKLRESQPLGKYQKLFSKFKCELNKAHGCPNGTIIYRGLSGIRSTVREKWTVGMTLENLGIIWCAREQWLAHRFTHDTRHYYNNHKLVSELWNNSEYETIHSDGILLRITLPTHTRTLESEIYVKSKQIYIHQLILYTNLYITNIDWDTGIIDVRAVWI
jgi:hypothetical protein